jgi:hypothetical protein
MCRHAEPWVYRLEHHVSWSSGHAFPEDLAFEDKIGVRWLEVTRTGAITILSGYSWDGCTPKVCILDLQFGIPDGVVDTRTGRPKTYFASLVHDVLYQFLDDGLPLTRGQVDRFFLALLGYTDFTWRHIYFAAVRAFGGLFRLGAKRVRKTLGVRVPFVSSLASGQHIVVTRAGETGATSPHRRDNVTA